MEGRSLFKHDFFQVKVTLGLVARIVFANLACDITYSHCRLPTQWVLEAEQ